MSVQVVQAASVVGAQAVEVQVPLGQEEQVPQISSPASNVHAAQTVLEVWPRSGWT